MNASSSLIHSSSRTQITFLRSSQPISARILTGGVLAVWGAHSCIGGALKELIKRQRAQHRISAGSHSISASSRKPMALHTAASPSAAAATSAKAAETVVEESPDTVTPQARGHPRQSEECTSAPASTSAPEQPAKRRKQSVPPPTMVRKGSSFTPAVWHNAAVLVDKPQNWTSFDVCGKLRGALKIKKVGHAGTLDPMATGLLIICTGRGTKQIDDFVAMEKAYTGTLRLGQATPSYDAMSEIEEEVPWDHITDEDLEAAKQAFLGDILQQPPMFSAVKIQGERLYKAARRGEVVVRQSRPVTIHSFELRRDDDNRQDVHFRVACSKGTYIRSLAHDLGRAVGSAAHLIALRRENIGTHNVADAWSVPDLVAAAQAAREDPTAAQAARQA